MPKQRFDAKKGEWLPLNDDSGVTLEKEAKAILEKLRDLNAKLPTEEAHALWERKKEIDKLLGKEETAPKHSNDSDPPHGVYL